MTHNVFLRIASVLSALLLTVSLGAQPAPARSPVPRAANGKPDLSGVWQGGSNRRGTWEEANTGGGVGGTGGTVPAQAANRLAREPAPYQPWAAKKVLESFNKRAVDDPTAFCLPPGIPRLVSVGLFPIQISQKADQVIMLYEYMNVFRVIPLNAKHPDDLEPSFLGDSVGHWEGDTLVVDITSLNDKTWLIGTGTFHSDKLHITERYTRVDKDQINYEAVMEDPTVFTRPWVYKTTMMLREGTRIREYACVENNLDPERYEKLIKDGVNFKR